MRIAPSGLGSCQPIVQKAHATTTVALALRKVGSTAHSSAAIRQCLVTSSIDKAEFEPRITASKLHMSQLDQQRRIALDTASADRELSLVINRLEDFSAKVAKGIDRLDWMGKRTIIHTLVR